MAQGGNTKLTLGRWGEEQAAHYIRGLGFNVLERNFFARVGELDIVAQRHGVLNFFEVKYSVIPTITIVITSPIIEEKKREKAGFEEAHQTDYDYLEAIEHGFPPTCGIAIGIDRMVMLFTNTPIIKEVILFPTLRPFSSSKTHSP